jgi:uncharacterized protein with HEPN domain
LRAPLLYLSEILSAVQSVKDFTSDMDREAFMGDEKTKSAVVRQFEIMGEAAKAVPEEVRSLDSTIPWSNIAGMRDRLIHAYFNVDYYLVWDTLESELPNLENKIEALILILNVRE